LLVAPKKAARWDAGFFGDRLVEYSKKGVSSALVTEKIWICGPPGMQETFDRVAEKNQGLFADRNVIHIV